MATRLKPLGHLKQYFEGQSEVLIEPGQSVRELLLGKNIKPELVAGVIVNGGLESKDYLIRDGDEIKIMSVMGGG